MARPRDRGRKRDEAFRLWKESSREFKKLKDIAE